MASAKKKFTEEEMKLLLSNPYTARVTPCTIKFTLDFKKFVIKEVEHNTRLKDIYIKAGYNPDLLGYSRMDHQVRMIRKEAASPEGLKPVEDHREEQIQAFASQDLSKVSSEKAVKKLQDEVIKLEQEIEFLKKILSLRK